MSDSQLTEKPAAKPVAKPASPTRDFLSRAGRQALEGGDDIRTVRTFWMAYLGFNDLTERDVIVMLDLAATARIASGNKGSGVWEEKVALAARGFETDEA